MTPDPRRRDRDRDTVAAARRRSCTPRDCGQASVELALCLPVVVGLAMGLVQIALVVRDQITVDLVAREAARRAVVAVDPRAAAIATAHELLGPGVEVEIDVTVGEHTVRVEVRTRPSTVPPMGAIVRDRQLSGHATMALEPPPP